MKPGKTLDWDHLSRCELYVSSIEAQVQAETALGLKKVSGLVVADAIAKNPNLQTKIYKLEADDIRICAWKTLIEQAKSSWKDYLFILGERAPQDARLQQLKNSTTPPAVGQQFSLLS
jgi:hypothetical protein